MALVQVRDVDDATVRALKQHAARRGRTLAAYLRGELTRLAHQPTNADVAERLASRSRHGGPSVSRRVAELRRTRADS